MNHRNQIFVSEYIKTGNATASAIKAGYSEKTSYSIGQRLLKNVEIMQAISKHQQDISKAADISITDIVKEVRMIALHGKNDYIKLKALDMLMKHLGGYVNEFKLITEMDEKQIDSLTEKLLTKLN